MREGRRILGDIMILIGTKKEKEKEDRLAPTSQRNPPNQRPRD
jgi:hypothetical protein